ncbi:MAG TPA: four helix bundle protein, partial [Phnomibacter sp.]|nr:four helix bundle protein [Phnomibacter sp.]
MIFISFKPDLNNPTMKVHNFKDLKVWNLSVDLATKAYKITQKFPADERYGSTTQAQRSAISIASNIAEGCGRIGKGDFMRFVSISMGSSYELETQITISFKLGYI